MPTNINSTGKEYWLTQAQFNAKELAGTLEVGAKYHIKGLKEVPQPTSSDNGKIIGVDSNGVYVLITKDSIKSEFTGSIAAGNTGFITGDAAHNALTAKADLVDGKIPTSELPSYVDDVINITSINTVYSTVGQLPTPSASINGSIYIGINASQTDGPSLAIATAQQWAKGVLLQCYDVGGTPTAWTLYEEMQSGKIYVAIDTNKTYRFTMAGATHLVEISASLALGETSGTAYEGNKGKANADAITALQTAVASKTSGAKLGGASGTDATVVDGKIIIPNAANNSVGLVRGYANYSINVDQSTGILSADSSTYSTYSSRSNSSFVGKGTLENVLDNETIRVDKSQSLSSTQKAQALSNLGGQSSIDIEVW